MDFSYIIFVLILILHESTCYFVTIDANAEECFFDKVNAGTKMGK